MKILTLFLVLSFFSLSCKKSEINSPSNNLKQIFNSLPAAKVYNNQGAYRLLVDTINYTLLAYYHVSGKLFYQEKLLWQTDSAYIIMATGNDNLVFIQDTYAPIGAFSSYLFYQGKDISSKARPKNFPLICAIRPKDNIIYLLYSDYGSFRRNEAERYGSYDLITGVLKTD